jgi:hypothetical protein
MYSTPQHFRPFRPLLLSAVRPLVLSALRPIVLAAIRPFLRFGGGDKTARIRCLNRPTEWSFWNPSGKRPAGTQTHSRRTGERLGRLQRARQGVVRVSESNTKYGGNRGKPGGPSRARLAQVSVSPEGFPREKICDREVPADFTPFFTGEVFFPAPACLAETHVSLRGTHREVVSGIPFWPWFERPIGGNLISILPVVLESPHQRPIRHDI